MKLKTQIYLIIIWMVVIQIERDYIPRESLDGHWHTTFYIDGDTSGRYTTFDIYGNAGRLDALNDRNALPLRVDKKKKLIEYASGTTCFMFTRSYQKKGDKLILSQKRYSSSFDDENEDKYAYKIENCSKQKDFYAYKSVNIDLPIIQNQDLIINDLSEYRVSPYLGDLYIGTIKGGINNIAFLQIHNTMNMFGDTSSIGYFVDVENRLFGDSDANVMGIKLHINKHTPAIYLLKILDRILKSDYKGGIYLANRYDTDVHKAFKIGWLPLTGKLPRARKMTYEEWLKVYYEELENIME